jgi:2-polyprenyl-6-methoxyphenol hydroxylase-like FAD-dependent oxidoreductase
MRVLIAGAGIGGLAAALSVHQAGFDVRLFDRASELGEIADAKITWVSRRSALPLAGHEVALAPSRALLGRGDEDERLHAI